MTRPCSQRPVQRLFIPESVAVVGASPTPGKIGNVLLRNLAQFTGRVYPVHPTASEVLGRKAYPHVGDIPEPVDLALLAIPAESTAQAIKECAEAGFGAAVIYSGGWAETGDAGISRQQELAGIARNAGMRLLGPNTSGFVSPAVGLFATFVADVPEILHPGTLAIVSQSGGVNLSLSFLAQEAGLGIRLAVGLGNAMDITWNDVLECVALDDGVSAVVLAMEGVALGRELFHSLKKLTARRPVVALKLGRVDVSAFAKSHTGALTGSYRTTRAALTQAGAVVVEDMTELMDAACALGATRLPPLTQPGVGVVTGQAGSGLLLADALGTAGVRIPPLDAQSRSALCSLLPPRTYQVNPVDTGRPSETFGKVVEVVRYAPGIDLLAVSLLYEPDAVDPVAVLAGKGPAVMISQGPVEAMALLRSRLRTEGIPMYSTPDRAARGITALVRDAQRQAARESTKQSAPRRAVSTWRPPDGPWDEISGKALARELGLATCEGILCSTREEAREALRRLGGPVVVKVVHAEIAHKTEVGGVHLGIRNETDLALALDAIDKIPGSRYFVEKMATGGPELLLGARRDPAFGPIVVLGAGGVEAEGADDVSVRLAPLEMSDAREMLDELACAFKFRGWRGHPAVNEDALTWALLALGDLIAAREDLAEVEFNPLRHTAFGLLVLDALVIPK